MKRQPWPTVSEYRRAIADPSALRRDDIRSGSLETLADGPKVYGGTRAATFRVTTDRGDVAFRCFTRGDDDGARRYSAIAELQRYVHSDALCPTDYIAEAIRVGDTVWPAVVMPWVSGHMLDIAVGQRLNDSDALLRLALEFREVVRSLAALGIAHGDLQHGNILVARNHLRLIDYDAMFLPAIADVRASECGHRNYQHPQRRNARFDGRLDRFSALVIYTSLIALTTDPSLWTAFHDGDNLLFRAHDFTSGGRSELCRRLLTSNATSGLAGVLLAAAAGSVDDVPTLEEAIATTAGTMVASAPEPPPRRAPVYPANSAERRQRGPAEPSVPAAAATTVETRATTQRSRPVRFARALAIVATVFVGLLIGFGVAAFNGGAARNSARVAGTSVTPSTTAVVRPKHQATTVAAIAPTITPAHQPTPAPQPTPALATPKTNLSRARASWQVVEANDQIGTIVWTGAASLSGTSLVLDTYKRRVGGQSATPCELNTRLSAAVAVGVSQQTVPYRETNCAGTTSMGEIRVERFAPDGTSFGGSIWRDGTHLGDFTARRQ